MSLWSQRSSSPGEEDDAVALVRVYCGLASADDSVRSASAAPLTIAVVDDAGRLLGVHEISDDPAGYAQLGSLLVERTTGFGDAAVAADSDDHVVTSLLTAAGRPLVVVDDDDADDFAERFSDDDSPEEIQAPAAARRAVGLARALQAGAIAAVNLPTPRDLVSYKPVLAAHVAMLNGRNSAAVALREVLRELYPAALRAYPDPAHPLALAVLDAVPEPGRLTGRGGDPDQTAREIATELVRAGAGHDDEVTAAVTALHVAISESPRRGGVNKSLAPAAADAVRQAIGAVRSCDAACSALVGTLSARAMPQTSSPNVGRRAARRASEPAPLQPVPSSTTETPRFGRRGRPEPAAIGNGPASPQPMTTQPVAPPPIAPPPVAPAAANGLPGRAGAPGNRP
ncbi:transposase, partial [Actinoplanes sp. NPDC024001]